MDTDRIAQLTAFQKDIGYTFKRLSLLDLALTHSSYKNEFRTQSNTTTSLADNERLEFLGDTILAFCLSKKMFDEFHDWNEGKLSKYRSIIVSKNYLFKVAQLLKISQVIQLGKGEAAGTIAQKSNQLADAVEAIIAAIYLDGGMKNADKFVMTFFGPFLKKSRLPHLDKNHKSALQEYVQKTYKKLPTYTTVENDGTFHATVNITKSKKGIGTGKNKREAEQRAAKNLLSKLKKKK